MPRKLPVLLPVPLPEPQSEKARKLYSELKALRIDAHLGKDRFDGYVFTIRIPRARLYAILRDLGYTPDTLTVQTGRAPFVTDLIPLA